VNFFFEKIKNKKDSQSDFIIFDDTNSNLIQQVIPQGYTFSIFKTRPVELILFPSILLKILKNIIFLRPFQKFTSNKNFITNILWQLLCIYIKSYIELANPKAVITSIDNCTKFAWLSKHIPEIPFVSIQNGFRLGYAVDDECLYHSQHFFCFGKYEELNFPKRSWNVDNFYPVGSLYASLNFKKFYDTSEKEFDILVISCWRGNIGFQKDVEDSMKAMKLFDIELAQYLKENNLKASVIMRSERLSSDWYMPEIGMNEEEYYYSIYGENITITDVDFNERNVYQQILKSEFILAAFPSTCLFEALGIGKKVLYCDYTNHDNYFSEIPDNILYKGARRELLADRLSNIIRDDGSKYQEICKSYKSMFMNIDSSIHTQDIIKTKILDILKH
tara:strand:- start:26817 stop:27986 length:1170 start_codon:yes stop_codon:yes gene_type:complete